MMDSSERMDINMLVTTLGYMKNGSQVLLLHRTRKKNDINQEKWIGIGGKLEEGEGILECMKRECREETGLDWPDPILRGVITFNFRKHPEDPLFSELMFLFSGKAPETIDLCDCKEGELVWMDWPAVRDLNLWKGDRIFLHLLETNAPLFFMTLDYLGDDLLAASLNGRALDLEDPSLYL